jgi:hypothetical protein
MGSGRSSGQRQCGGIPDPADLGVGASVVVAGTNEPASVHIVERDLVTGSGQPGQDAAGLADLVAVVGRHSGRSGGAFRIGDGLGRYLTVRWWTAWGERQSDRERPGTC